MIISEALAATAEAGHEAVAFYASPEFWVSVSFIIVVVLIAKPVVKAVKAITMERAEKISQKINQANTLKDDAMALLNDYENRFKNKELEKDAILEKAKLNVERFKKEASEDMSIALAKKEEQIENRIRSSRQKVADEIKSSVVNTSVDAVSHILINSISDKDKANLLDNSINELPNSLKSLAS